jgi:hypothetical protein
LFILFSDISSQTFNQGIYGITNLSAVKTNQKTKYLTMPQSENISVKPKNENLSVPGSTTVLPAGRNTIFQKIHFKIS